MYNKEKFENPFITLQIKSGILHAYYKEVVVDLEAAQRIVADRLDYSEGKSYPVLIVDAGLIDMTKEARRYFSSQQGQKDITACAIIPRNAFITFMANLFILFDVSAPMFPIKIFNNKEDGLEWLRSYVKGGKGRKRKNPLALY